MLGSLTQLDWTIICAYLAGIMGFAIWLSRGQNSREDYYVGARRVGPWPVALSIMATQCSTNSILGAPAFVAFAAGGGLVWLQYELALPLAMIFLILFVMPLFRHLKLVSIYEYLELRFDLRTRLVLSGLFLFIRAFATAVTVYSIALVIDLITGVGFFWSVMLLGTFTVVYDIFGGIRGVIYSDVIQLLILVMVLILLLVLLTDSAGGFTALLNDFDPQRRQAIDLSHHGFGDGQTFAFWPMLVGGFFLYVSYYGCDQSQVQRSLSTEGIDQTNQALFLNGLLRFPLVALYCLVGVGIAVLAADSPDFLQLIPTNDGTPEYNLAVPVYMLMALPAGLVGLAMVALFAAAMSSLDSVINSLSATTMEDFVRRFSSRQRTDREELMLSRWLTVFWGVVTLSMSFFVGDIAPTVLEAINKIGSLANGPILAVFMLGFFVKRVNGPLATFGLLLGIAVNGVLWIAAPAVSWLWWNPIGFTVAFLIPVVMSFVAEDMTKKDFPTMRVNFGSAGALANAGALNWQVRSVFLVLWCGLLCGGLVML
ncbi:MAG: sodium:solute symporter [Halieaceae bacterium]